MVPWGIARHGDGMPDYGLTAEEHAALVHELETVRARYETELAHRLRDARSFGLSTDNDDLLAVHGEAAIERARIAQLEELVYRATNVDPRDADGAAAGLGALVRVSDERDRVAAYELVGRRRPDAHGHQVTPASPLGRMLTGARVGDIVRVTLPSGRERALRVLEISYRDLADAA